MTAMSRGAEKSCRREARVGRSDCSFGMAKIPIDPLADRRRGHAPTTSGEGAWRDAIVMSISKKPTPRALCPDRSARPFGQTVRPDRVAMSWCRKEPLAQVSSRLATHLGRGKESRPGKCLLLSQIWGPNIDLSHGSHVCVN